MNKQLKKLSFGVLLIVCLVTVLTPTYALSKSEYSIKAAFLVKFLDFISWDNFKNKSGETITIIGKDPFGKVLDDYVSRVKEKNNLNLKVVRTKYSDTAFDGQVIFSAETDPSKIAKLIENMKNKRVLTVGEGEQFAKLGGTIAFIIKNNKVRFIINLKSAKKAGIKISSKLLRLAKVIR